MAKKKNKHANKGVDWYMGLMNELDTDFQDVVDLFENIDTMVRPEWSLPTEFTAVIKDVMAVVDTAPSDAINSGAIALSGSMPIFNVTPFGANRMEYDRAQKLESALTFNFKKSNTRGDGTIMYDIADSSLRYNTIAVRTDDLAYILPKNQKSWTPLQKAAWGNGRFLHQVYNPKEIRYTHTSLGLTMVGYTETMRVQDVINHWELYENNETDEGKMIAAELKELRENSGMAGKTMPGGMRGVYFTQSYAIDYDGIAIWGSITNVDGEDLNQLARKDYVFAEQENEYGFLPWSIRVAGSRLEKDLQYRVNPLLAPLYWSGSWDKLNLAKSIIFSEPIRRARNPRGVSMTQDGTPVTVDHQNGSDIALRTGEDYKPFNALTLDPNALNVVAQLEAAMNRTTGASMIGDTTKISSNTPFSTFSAMVKVALSRLDKQRQIMADSTVDMQCNVLKWVTKTDIPLSAYMDANKALRSGTKLPMGSKIHIMADDYDENNLGISARIRPSTPTDQMEQLNMAVIMSTKLNQPVSQLLEEMGYDNVGLSYELWTQEFLKTAATQATAAGMQAEAVGMAQAKVQQAMQALQQPPAAAGGGGAMGAQGGGEMSQNPNDMAAPMGAGGGISQTSFGGLGGQEGFNPAMGGDSATAAAPSMGREQISGKTQMQR